jgi:hypothetical protein
MQLGAEAPELFLMGVCQLVEKLTAARGEGDIYLAPIFVTSDADDQFLRP